MDQFGLSGDSYYSGCIIIRLDIVLNCAKNSLMNLIETQSPLTDQDLKQIELQLGFLFPKDLRQHYLTFNGGRPVPNVYSTTEQFYTIHEFLSIHDGIKGNRFEDTFQDLVLDNEHFPKNLIPFAIDPSGDYFCYSLQKDHEGEICLFQAEYYDDPKRSTQYIAKSLQHFLESLI